MKVCVLEQGGTWDSHLPLIEFTYNNNYHSSIGMAPFEALYGRRCRTPLCWFESGESVVLGPDIVEQTTEKVKLIQEKMKASQSRQRVTMTSVGRTSSFGKETMCFLESLL